MDPSESSEDKDRPEEDYSALKETLGLEFHDEMLLKQALTHSSFVNENAECHEPDNEGLEFLGDAILGLVISEHLFRRLPKASPGELSRLKSIIVSGSVLYKKAFDLELGRFIRLGKGEEQSGGRNRESLLADTLEGVIAAVYVDCGMRAAEGFILRLLGDEVEQLVQTKETPDYKSLVQQFSQARFRSLPKYRVVLERGPQHQKTFEVEVTLGGEVMGRGTGRSKKKAEQEAAREAWEHLGSWEQRN